MNIRPVSVSAAEKARERVDGLVKPIGSLGRLEEYAARLAGIFAKTNLPPLKKAIAVFAADNGVWDEGISPVPQSVTAMQAVNIHKGITGVGVLAGCAGADVFVYDMGIRGFAGHKGVEDRRVGDGTLSIARGPAMDIGQAIKAIVHGMDAAEALWEKGYRMLGCGEMGICNTSTSSAVLCALTGAEAEEAVGRGAGLTDGQLAKKIDVVRTALETNRPDPDDALGVIAKLGGFDIAAMAGFFLGAAYKQVPVVIDGFISAVAALAAFRLNAAAAGYMFASHCSAEPGFAIAMEALGLFAPLQLDMRLGEGSGCPLMFAVLDGAAAVLTKMATFAEAHIDPSKLVDIRK
jgi:nicotinate-nucleotide--dimethylbenzimidazole phosphoribosyltransferase